jgi:hypothetical protein
MNLNGTTLTLSGPCDGNIEPLPQVGDMVAVNIRDDNVQFVTVTELVNCYDGSFSIR